MANKILRLPAVEERVGVKRSSIYDWISKNQFPSGFVLGKRARGWLESDIEKWIEARTKDRNAKSGEAHT